MRRSIAVLLCILLVLSLLPIQIFASDNDCAFTVEGIPESIDYSVKAVYTDTKKNTEDYSITNGQFPLKKKDGKFFYQLVFSLPKVAGLELKNVAFKDYKLSADNSSISFTGNGIRAQMRWAEDAQNYTVGIYCTLAMEKILYPLLPSI